MQRANAIAVVYELAEAAMSTASGVLERGRQNMSVVSAARHQVARLISRDAILAGQVSFDADWHRGTFTISAARQSLLEGLPLTIGSFTRNPLPN
jgi:hypothetical protein